MTEPLSILTPAHAAEWYLLPDADPLRPMTAQEAAG